MAAAVKVKGFLVILSLARQSVQIDTDMVIGTTPGDVCRRAWMDYGRASCRTIDNLFRKREGRELEMICRCFSAIFCVSANRSVIDVPQD